MHHFNYTPILFLESDIFCAYPIAVGISVTRIPYLKYQICLYMKLGHYKELNRFVDIDLISKVIIIKGIKQTLHICTVSRIFAGWISTQFV